MLRVKGGTGSGIPERMVSLDVFRGITIAAMILVDQPGSWDHVYSPLRHAAWNGWTPADLVFPFFLFIVGVAVPLSFAGRISEGDRPGKILLQVLRRTIILFALGLVLNEFPHYHTLSTIRFGGVLQRIGLCYFFASLIFLRTGVRGQAGATVALLAGYWLLMNFVPVPGHGAGVLDKEGNLAAYVDNIIMAGHLYQDHWDPEGLLTTLPAIASTLLGVLTSHGLRTSWSPRAKTLRLLGAGAALVLIGQLMDLGFPINKSLWSSSYVVFTGGMALLFLGACTWIVDFKHYRRWAKPFIVLGMNAIAVYVLSDLGGQILDTLELTRPDGSPVTLRTFLYEHLFASWAGPLNGSLIFALTYLLLWLAPMALLYRKRIFIRI